MAFLLRAASVKGQTPLKLRSGALNADMTFTRPFGMLALDGVSGVADEGLEPATFPRELRDVIRRNLTVRNARVEPYKRDAYDRENRPMMDNNARVRKPEAGSWLRHLVGASVLQCCEPGSTTMACVSMLGRKLTTTILGDCKIWVFRYSESTRNLRLHWESAPQRETQLSDGRWLPNQIYMNTKESFQNTSLVAALMDKANTHVVPVELWDIVVVGSDGFWENLPGNDMLRALLNSLGSHDDPDAIAKGTLQAELTAGLKEDDVSCCVGIAFPMNSA